VIIGLYSWWIKLIKLTPSGTQLTPDMTPVPFATLDAHLIIQIAMSSNNAQRDKGTGRYVPRKQGRTNNQKRQANQMLSSDPFYLTVVSKSNVVDNKY